MVSYRNTHQVLHQFWIFLFCITEISFALEATFKEHCGRSWNRTNTHGTSHQCSTIWAILPLRLPGSFGLLLPGNLSDIIEAFSRHHKTNGILLMGFNHSSNEETPVLPLPQSCSRCKNRTCFIRSKIWYPTVRWIGQLENKKPQPATGWGLKCFIAKTTYASTNISCCLYIIWSGTTGLCTVNWA